MLSNLTIAIPVKNEERLLRSCLLSIGKDFANKIIVIDSASTDGTKEIALEFGAEVIDFKWNGKFPKKRNWFLQHHTPQTKWVLFLDADEHLTPETKLEISAAVQQEDVVGYWLKYTIYFMGRKLRGGYPLRKLALFRVGAGMYERIEEDNWSSLDMEIHEHPVLQGKIGYLKNKIDHKDFRDIGNYIQKHDEYAAWEARRYFKSRARHANTSIHWTWKQKIKYRSMTSVWIGPLYFFGSLFFYRGFLDGARGLSFAVMKMAYFNQVYCRIRELQAKKQTRSAGNKLSAPKVSSRTI